jgi:hypothetical protein
MVWRTDEPKLADRADDPCLIFSVTGDPNIDIAGASHVPEGIDGISSDYQKSRVMGNE